MAIKGLNKRLRIKGLNEEIREGGKDGKIEYMMLVANTPIAYKKYLNPKPRCSFMEENRGSQSIISPTEIWSYVLLEIQSMLIWVLDF